MELITLEQLGPQSMYVLIACMFTKHIYSQNIYILSKALPTLKALHTLKSITHSQSITYSAFIYSKQFMFFLFPFHYSTTGNHKQLFLFHFHIIQTVAVTLFQPLAFGHVL